jgi:MacB-like periplasmic core domain
LRYGNRTKASGIERFLPLTYPDYVYYRDHAKTFSGMIAFDGDPEGVTWNRDGNGEVVQSQVVSGNFFSTLGVPATMGRTISPADDAPAAEPVATISSSFWRGRLGSDPNVVGKRLVLNGVEYRVVGVMPAGFEGLEIAIEPDSWVPMAMAEKITRDTGRLTSWNSYWLFGVGRLKAGVGIAEARAEMNVMAEQIARGHPDTRKDRGVVVYPQTMVPGPFRGYVGAFTGLLTGRSDARAQIRFVRRRLPEIAFACGAGDRASGGVRRAAGWSSPLREKPAQRAIHRSGFRHETRGHRDDRSGKRGI